MQRLLRLVNDGQTDMQRKIANARDLLASLPPTNGFKRSEDLHHDHKLRDARIYDLLLHEQDRAYTVGELFDWMSDGQPAGHRLHLAFTDVQRGLSPYLPHRVLGSKPPAMAAALRQLPRRQPYERAELMGGSIITHSLCHAQAAYGDAAMVPFSITSC
jgi:hypothetical protein